jgi:queuine tRNA-ribosyltransferase
LRLLDIGLGAGSNAAAAHRLSERLGSDARPLEIVSFERDLAAFALALQPEHRDHFGLDGTTTAAATAVLQRGVHRSARTLWRVQRGELPDTLAREPAASADVVFWDPFSPRAQPALWTVAAFAQLRRVCREGATVHTYSGATSVRAALLLAGFAVGVGIDVSPGKASTCAATTQGDLERPLDARWLERLGRSSAAWPADAPSDAWSRIQALAQFQR